MPVIYIIQNTMVLDKPSECSLKRVEAVLAGEMVTPSQQQSISKLKDEQGVGPQEGVRRHRKRKSGNPNPLSCMKKKKKGSTQSTASTDGEKKKKSRPRKRKPAGGAGGKTVTANPNPV